MDYSGIQLKKLFLIFSSLLHKFWKHPVNYFVLDSTCLWHFSSHKHLQNLDFVWKYDWPKDNDKNHLSCLIAQHNDNHCCVFYSIQNDKLWEYTECQQLVPIDAAPYYSASYNTWMLKTLTLSPSAVSQWNVF